MSDNNHLYNILVVDDEPLIRKSLFVSLKQQGFNAFMASNAQEVLALLPKTKIDIIIADMNLPGVSGIDILRRVKKDYPDIEVVLITGYGTIETAVEAMKLKAFDYITKPIVDDEIKIVIQKIIEKKEILQENKDLKQIIAKGNRSSFHGLIGASPKMQAVYRLIESVASTNATIMISGQSGTGKGVVARAIHECDTKRRHKPFVEVSCGALSETLLESELFGHVKGSFTGAIKDKVGRFEAANGGTIFLDEIDTCSGGLQIKLLRILQDGGFERVGENTSRRTDARIIVASNQDLSKLVKESKFREDLFYRIHVVPIDLPALHERREDIPLLVEYFIDLFNKKNHKKITGIADDVRDFFMSYSWPGNVRQLENLIEGSSILTSGTLITKVSLPKVTDGRSEEKKHDHDVKSLKQGVAVGEKEMILSVLNKVNWNRSKAADHLGVNRTTLYNKMKKYGIDYKK